MLTLNSQCSPQKSAGLDNQYNPLNPHMSDSWTSVQPHPTPHWDASPRRLFNSVKPYWGASPRQLHQLPHPPIPSVMAGFWNGLFVFCFWHITDYNNWHLTDYQASTFTIYTSLTLGVIADPLRKMHKSKIKRGKYDLSEPMGYKGSEYFRICCNNLWA